MDKTCLCVGTDIFFQRVGILKFFYIHFVALSQPPLHVEKER